jgi:hypothetical protein
MGARATITMIPLSKTIEDKDNCPSIYVHWHGAMVEQLLEKAKEVMGGRLGEGDHTFARLVQVICNEVDCFEDTRRYGNISVGVGTYGDICHGDDYGDYFVDNRLDIIEHTKGKWQV